jgi:hypothetical protein
MRRKLIKQDAFDRITNESVTTAERELVEAAPYLARTIGKDQIDLHGFNESVVVFQAPDDTYVHAGYEIKNENIDFTNIEELVIDETTRREKQRATLSEMIDSVLQDDHARAKDLFTNYLGMVRWNEFKDSRAPQRATNESTGDNKAEILKAAKAAGILEAYKVAQNVLEYVEFMKLGPTLSEAIVKTDEKGNVTDIRIPTRNLRNEERIKRMNWKVPNAELHDCRKSVPALVKESEFCKAMAHLKRQNAFSDQEALEEVLEAVVKTWPDLLYVTQDELSGIIAEALQTAGVSNYDDQTCAFMAEGILRKAHSAYSEKVAQIMYLANAPKAESSVDPYGHFQNVVEHFYSALDEKFGLEKRAFSDLYEALETVYRKAENHSDEALMHEAAAHLNGLAAILNGEIGPDLEMANEAAQWLSYLVEANVEGAGKWSVSNKPHLTVSGDHPQMAKNAKVPAVAGRHEGEWGDKAPAIGQDNHNYKGGKNAKTMRHDSWGQEGGGDVFPKLKNPYVPKPYGDWTMKGEKGVDKNATGQHHATWQTSDTWPDLQNPYVPKEAGGVGGKGHKMKDGPETDLVVDK